MEKLVVYQVLQAVIRYLIAGVAMFLISHKIIDAELGTKFTDELSSQLIGGVIFLGLVAWAYIRKRAETYFKRNLAIAGADKDMTTTDSIVAKAAELQAAGNKPASIKGELTSVEGMRAVIALLLAFGLVTNIGCAGGDRPNLTPVQVAAETASYATDSVKLVDSAVQATSAYAIAQGGRTLATDNVVKALQDQVMPRARDLQRVLTLAKTTTAPDLQKANQAEIKKALDGYEAAFEGAIGSGKLPEGLNSALATSVVNIRELIKNIRVSFRLGGV